MTKIELIQVHNIHYANDLEGSLTKEEIGGLIPHSTEIESSYFFNQVGSTTPIALMISLKSFGGLQYPNIDNVKVLMEDFGASKAEDLIGRSVVVYKFGASYVGLEKAD